MTEQKGFWGGAVQNHHLESEFLAECLGQGPQIYRMEQIPERFQETIKPQGQRNGAQVSS